MSYRFTLYIQFMGILSASEVLAKSDNPIDRAIFGGLSGLIVVLILAILYFIKK